MADSKEEDNIELIFHILHEHEEKFEAIEKKLDNIRKIMDQYAPLVQNLSKNEKKTESQDQDIPKSILIVDDDPNVVKTFKMILASAGYSVESANNALEAIRKTSRLHFDLVIIDMNLPDTLGDELAERLSNLNEKIRVMMITGYSNYKERLEKNLEIIDVLMKPVNPEELIAATKKTLQKK
ncbi:response regulator [Candidatus Bathyarchaeota archaeon]|nr:response regulator [Candidatus Bathyarchaeota archaeon]